MFLQRIEFIVRLFTNWIIGVQDNANNIDDVKAVYTTESQLQTVHLYRQFRDLN